VNEEKPKETKKTKEEASSVDETESMEVEQTEEQKLEEKRALRIKDINIQLKELEKAGMQREPRIVSKVNHFEKFIKQLLKKPDRSTKYFIFKIRN